MIRLSTVLAATALVAVFGAFDGAQAKCATVPVTFNGTQAEVEAAATITAGTSCLFSISGFSGAISEVRILQPPKVGRAGIRNLRAFYVAKPGYVGPDDFTYAFLGKDQYGNPMRVVFKRRITVTP